MNKDNGLLNYLEAIKSRRHENVSRRRSMSNSDGMDVDSALLCKDLNVLCAQFKKPNSYSCTLALRHIWQSLENDRRLCHTFAKTFFNLFDHLVQLFSDINCNNQLESAYCLAVLASSNDKKQTFRILKSCGAHIFEFLNGVNAQLAFLCALIVDNVACSDFKPAHRLFYDLQCHLQLAALITSKANDDERLSELLVSSLFKLFENEQPGPKRKLATEIMEKHPAFGEAMVSRIVKHEGSHLLGVHSAWILYHLSYTPSFIIRPDYFNDVIFTHQKVALSENPNLDLLFPLLRIIGVLFSRQNVQFVEKRHLLAFIGNAAQFLTKVQIVPYRKEVLWCLHNVTLCHLSSDDEIENLRSLLIVLAEIFETSMCATTKEFIVQVLINLKQNQNDITLSEVKDKFLLAIKSNLWSKELCEKLESLFVSV